MKLVRKLLVAVSVLALLSVTTFKGSASAQVGYSSDDPVLVRVGSGKVDFDGKFAINYTAAPEVNDPHLVYVIGTDEDGEAFEWLAMQITSEQAGEGVTIEGSNLQPGSNYGLEARFAGQTISDAQVEEATELVAASSDAEITVSPIGLVNQISSSASADSPADSDDAAEDEDGGEEVAAPSTSDSGGGSGIAALLIGLGTLIAVMLGAIAYGKRLRTRYS